MLWSKAEQKIGGDGIAKWSCFVMRGVAVTSRKYSMAWCLASRAIEEDPLKVLADGLQDRKGIEVRESVEGDKRVAFFRGKDFYRYFRAHPEKLDEVVPSKPDVGIEDRIKAAGNALLRHRYIYRSDRLNKTPKPGKKLLKFPKKTVVHPVQEFVEDGFYTWIYEKPRKFLNAILSIGLVVFTISCCLLPVAPNFVKIAVFYASLTMFSLLISLLIIRLVLFGSIWLILGKHFWLLPNVMSDELPVVEAFKPLYTMDKDAKKPDLLSRVVALVGAGLVFWALYRTGPDGSSVRQATQRAHDDLLEFFNLAAPKQLSANQTNATESNTVDPNAAPVEEPSLPLNDEL